MWSIAHATTGGPPLGISLGWSGTGASLWIETSKSPSLGRSFSGCANAGFAIARAAVSRLTTDTIVRKLRLVSPSLHATIEAVLRLPDYLFNINLRILSRNFPEHYTLRRSNLKQERAHSSAPTAVGGAGLAANTLSSRVH